MEKYVKIAGWLWIVNGVLSILMVIIGLTALNFLGHIPNPRDALLVTVGSSCFFLPGMIADIVAGFALLKFKKWARVLAVILAIFNIVFLFALIVPLALGIYTLIIMFNKETIPLFG